MTASDDIAFPDFGSEAAFRLGSEGTEADVRQFLNNVDDAEVAPEYFGALMAGAVRARRAQPVAWALAAGIPCECFEFVLLGAVDEQFQECVELLLDHGVNVNATDRQGRTGLIVASRKGDVEIVRQLLRHHASLAPCDSHNESALYYAAQLARAGVVALLLEHGADVNARQGQFGETALHAAAWGWNHDNSGEEYRPIIQLLTKHGAEINARDESGRSPLFTAAMSGRVPALDELCRLGAALDSREIHEHTVLHAAVIGKHYRATEYLLERGFQTDLKNEHGGTPLHYALYSPEIAKLLIMRGADVNAPDHDGNTPLHIAALQGQVAVVNLLLVRSSDPQSRNRSGATPAEAALERGHRDCAKVIWEFEYRKQAQSADPLSKPGLPEPTSE